MAAGASIKTGQKIFILNSRRTQLSWAIRKNMMTTQDVVCSAMVTLLSNITIFYTFCIQAGFQVDFFFLFLTEFCHSSSSTCNLFQDRKGTQERLGDVGAHSGQLVSPSQVCTYTISTVSYECTINAVLNLHVLDCGKKSEYILKKKRAVRK